MKLVVYQEPIPKGRARTVRVNGRTMTFTPKATQEAEAGIRWEILKMADGDSNRLPFFPAGIPLSVKMLFVLVKPPSIPKKRIHPVVKPDGDNYQKCVWDACNGYLWADDAQICEWHGRKVYGTPPRIEIEVEPI
jgi:Holliday junction resolvase RusA-like endonuclease